VSPSEPKAEFQAKIRVVLIHLFLFDFVDGVPYCQYHMQYVMFQILQGKINEH
jgi:hypothetical protein